MLLDGGLVSVQWYDEADLAALVRVHAICYPTEAWTADDFRRFSEKPGQVVRSIVAGNGRVIGSMLYRMSAHEARIARVAVLPKYRRQGVATYAVRTLTGLRSPCRKEVCSARLREHDVASQLFLSSLGFSKTSTKAGYYKDAKILVGGEILVTDEDAYVFRYERPMVVARRRRQRRAVEAVTWP